VRPIRRPIYGHRPPPKTEQSEDKMKQLMILMAALMVGSACSAAPTKADFYLSPTGSDDWSGTLSERNAQGTDGPFATLERARDAVRDLKRSKSTDIVVLIRKGTYRLEKTVVFGLEDSGKGKSTVTYAAYGPKTHPDARSRLKRDLQSSSVWRIRPVTWVIRRPDRRRDCLS